MTPTWRVTPPSPPRPGLLARLLAWRPFRKPEPTAFHRCLALHMSMAARKGGRDETPARFA